MKALGLELSEKTLDVILNRYVNREGAINLDDFIQLCARLQSAKEHYAQLKGNVKGLSCEGFIALQLYV